MENRSDLDLIAAINDGEIEAFEALYFRYRDWVVSLAMRFIQSEDLALDVLQETFLYLHKKFPGFKLTCKFKTFLYPVVRHLALNAKHKAGRFVSREEALCTAEAEVIREDSGVDAVRDRLAAVLGALPEAQREVLLLRFVDDLSLEEISGAMGIPLGTVKSRLHHALSALRSDSRTRSWFEERIL